MELKDVGQLTVYETASNVTEDQHVVPAAASEPAVEPEPATESDPPADPWSKRWVPPKWLR